MGVTITAPTGTKAEPVLTVERLEDGVSLAGAFAMWLLTALNGPAFAHGGGHPVNLPGGDSDPKRLRWLVIPIASYDSDEKLGLGAYAELVQPSADVVPYRSAWVLQAFASTSGHHNHRFRFDLVGLGPARKGRLTGHFAYRSWMNDGYFGVGNGTIRERRYEYEEDDLEDPNRLRYRYGLIQPYGQLTWRQGVSGPLSLYGSVNVRYSFIETFEGSLLAEETPLGLTGGWGVQGAAGALWDTRWPEVTPEQGLVLEASGRMVTGAHSFGGPFASARVWTRLGSRTVLAQRLMGEWLFGEVPFYEMVHWGGYQPVAGFGGAETLRGVAFGRWRAPAKAVYNAELRVDVLRHRAFKQEVRWQVVPFADLGAVWGAEAQGGRPEWPVHPAGGAGIHVIWADTAVGRIDVGLSQDLTDDGTVLGSGFYLAFDQLF